MNNGLWQQRLKRLGMTQKQFASLIGFSTNAITTQLSGKTRPEPSRMMKLFILSLERLTPDQRVELAEALRLDEASGGSR